MREGDSKGEAVITLPRCSPGGSRALAVVIPRRERRRKQHEGEVGKWSFRILDAISLLCDISTTFFPQNSLRVKRRKPRNGQVSFLPGHEPFQQCVGWFLCILIVAYMPRAFLCYVWKRSLQKIKETVNNSVLPGILLQAYTLSPSFGFPQPLPLPRSPGAQLCPSFTPAKWVYYSSILSTEFQLKQSLLYIDTCIQLEM